MDRLTSEKRSALMRKVKTSHTGPELAVRRLAHGLGYRFRLHRRDLPGRPDLVFPSRRKVIFVHGCFWHGHDCKYGRLPKSRLDYWAPKIQTNRARDDRNVRELEDAGWSVMIVWQCEMRDFATLQQSLQTFLGPTKKTIDKIPQSR